MANHNQMSTFKFSDVLFFRIADIAPVMSSSDCDPVPVSVPGVPDGASDSSPGPAFRRSSRLASLRESDVRLQLASVNVTPAPGLGADQIQELAGLAGFRDEGSPVPAASAPHAPAARGRKRTSKSCSRAPPGKRTAPRSASSPPPSSQPDLATSLQALSSSLQSIDRRLRVLEGSALPVSRPADVSPDALAIPGTSSFSLSTAVPAPSMAHAYVPLAANVSPRLRSRILQGKDVNLVSLLLPSPDGVLGVSNDASSAGAAKHADPRLSRVLSIGEFLVAFGIFRDVVCSVYPDRRSELDGYLALMR
ncbi:uncharacterized protein LOC112146462 [Oryzias melastigma]|uniref:uncharacterized protein LOC112146462 n=1 Tax=Oryzias melastigma TaxID=30732 RepID=UPI00168CE8F4|nr:uncharacterized protein LOC112146462 [Oryzias melastigma]